MRIGIDARFFNESGVGRYLRNLLGHLKVLDKNNKYIIFLLSKDLNDFKHIKNFQKVEANFSWYGFAEQFKFPSLIKKNQIDLMHFPHFNIPVFYPGKFVVTIHDLIHQHHSMKRSTTLNPFAFKFKQLGYKKVFKSALLKSCKILVPSNSVRKLLEDEWRVASTKVVVTKEAVDDHLKLLGSKMNFRKVDEILAHFKINSPYIFYVGNAHPHKNIEGLIKAFTELKKNNSNLKLVLSGAKSYFWDRIIQENSVEGIIYTGYINEEQLVALYKGAAVLVIPSFEEGFGLPILEAMALGCPIVASNRASLPEVGGNAALYFDPTNAHEMTEKISQVLKSEDLHKKLISLGKKRSNLFSWKKLARQTLEVYLKCV